MRDFRDQTAFVAGSTGYTGRALVPALRSLGVKVVAHVRPGSPRLIQADAEFGAAGASIDQTPWEDEAIHATLARLQPTLVFGLLGTTKKRIRAHAKKGGSAAEVDYARVDEGMTLSLLHGAKASGSNPRFVYLSAIGAERGGNAYMNARKNVEIAMRESGLPWTSVRPAVISGPDRDESRPLEEAAAVLGDGMLGLLRMFGARRLADSYRSITATELAAGMAYVSLFPSEQGQVADLLTLREGARALSGLAQ